MKTLEDEAGIELTSRVKNNYKERTIRKAPSLLFSVIFILLSGLPTALIAKTHNITQVTYVTVTDLGRGLGMILIGGENFNIGNKMIVKLGAPTLDN